MASPSSNRKRIEFPGDVSVMFQCLYIAIAICGITGNFIFCYLFAAKKLTTNFFNLLLLNLSVSDIMSCISILPYAIIDPSWLSSLTQINANISCTFTYGQTPFWVATVASLFTLSYISAIRYVFIVHPTKSLQFRWLKQRSTSVRLMLITWPLASVILLVNFFSYRYDQDTEICVREWPENFNGQLYGLMTALVGFVLPMTILIFTFVSIKRSLKRQLPQSTQNQNKQKTVKLLGTLVLVFVICWGPFIVYWILSTIAGSVTFTSGIDGQLQRMRVTRCVLLVALSNTIANPLIYGLQRDDIKQALRSCIGRDGTE